MKWSMWNNQNDKEHKVYKLVRELHGLKNEHKKLHEMFDCT